MKFKIFSVMLMIGVLSVFAVGAAAQYEEHHADQQATQSQTQPRMMGQGQGMMGGGMMGMMNMMGQMTTHHQQMSGLMNKLMQSMTAIQNEKDPDALKQKLAEHSALLKQMHDQMMQEGNMMHGMSGMITTNCPATGNNTAPPTK